MPELVTLDSSVIVAALRKTEVHHYRCLSLLEKVKDGFYSAVEPYSPCRNSCSFEKENRFSEIVGESYQGYLDN